MTPNSRAWRLIIDGDNRGSWNMAVDEAMMLAQAGGENPPTIRLYGWKPPAVSIGYFQDFAREIDLESCRRLGIDWVRRPTGGRAVLHENEVTYSVVAPESVLRGSVLETYLELSNGLVVALLSLGADAGVVSRGGGHRGGSAACFDAPSSYEVVCGGKKVVGSAQTRHNGIILQHGSIPLRFDHARAAAVLKLDSERVRERIAATLNERAAGLEQALGRPVVAAEVREALVGGFAQALGLELLPGVLTGAEERDAARLEMDKYSSPGWNEQKQGR